MQYFILRSALVLLWLLPTTVVRAFDINVVAGYEASYSTNPGRDVMDETEQWIHTPSAEVGILHESRYLEIDADYSAERRFYQEDNDGQIDDESAVTGTGILNWNVVPERLVIGIEHYRTESTINSFQSAGPQNRQESQRATASATYFQPLVGPHSVSLRAATTENYFEETRNDARVNEGRFAYLRQISESRGWEIFVRARETEFDSFTAANYDSEGYGVMFYSSAPRGSLNVELGYTRTDPESAALDTVSGVTGSIEMLQGIASPFEWGLSVSREIGDRVNSMDRGTIDIETDIELFDSGLAEIFISTRASLSFAVNSQANTYGLEIAAIDDDYKFVNSDRSGETITARFERRIRETVTFDSFVAYSEQDFDGLDQQDELLSGQAGLSWSVSRKLELRASIAYIERTSSNAMAEYDEWLGAISFRYSLLN